MNRPTATLARSTQHYQSKDWDIGEEYQDALDRFANSLRSKAARTRENYVHGARCLLHFLEARWGGPSLEALSREHAESWHEWLSEQTPAYGPSTIRGFLIAGRVFAKKLIKDDVIKADPFAQVEIPQGAMPTVDILLAEDVQAMVNAAKSDRNVWGKRDIALMLLLYSGGFRRDELLAISTDAIDWKRSTIRVVGKGALEREVAPGDVALSALDSYDAARKKYLRGLRKHRQALLGASDAPIWLSQKGGPLGRAGLHHVLKVRAKQVDVTRAVHPHIWRHSAATSDADAGMADSQLRDKFGWSPTSAMPYRYTRSTLRQRTIERSQQVAAGNAIKI